MEKRVFYISVKNIPEADVKKYVQRIQKMLKQPFRILKVKQWKQMKKT